MNPIENVWGKMSSIVYADGKQYNNLNELEVAIQAAWTQISGEYRLKWYNSMKNRLIEVIQKRGVISLY